jgi:hypothetical protein
MSMLTNIDIYDYAHKYQLNLVGVYSKDQLPKTRESGGYIINLMNSTDKNNNPLPGSHWVSFYIESTNNKAKVVYFDSFGCVPPIIVQKFLNPFVPYPFNDGDIQNLNSGWCGWYCIYFIWFMQTHSKSIPDITKRFDRFLNSFDDTDPEKNLRILKRKIERIKD